jgi:hypothetical protein
MNALFKKLVNLDKKIDHVLQSGNQGPIVLRVEYDAGCEIQDKLLKQYRGKILNMNKVSGDWGKTKLSFNAYIPGSVYSFEHLEHRCTLRLHSNQVSDFSLLINENDIPVLFFSVISMFNFVTSSHLENIQYTLNSYGTDSPMRVISHHNFLDILKKRGDRVFEDLNLRSLEFRDNLCIFSIEIRESRGSVVHKFQLTYMLKTFTPAEYPEFPIHDLFK